MSEEEEAELGTSDEVKGIRFNEGKPRMSLIPHPALAEVARGMTAGAEKYSAHNYRHGLPWSAYADALARHMGAWTEGTDQDAETQVHHVALAACNALMLLQNILDSAGVDDRFKGDTNDRRRETDVTRHVEQSTCSPPASVPPPAYGSSGAYTDQNYLDHDSLTAADLGEEDEA
jgi:hypothetical protein